MHDNHLDATVEANRRPGRHGRRLLTGGLATLVGLASLVAVTIAATPASAATVNGIATIANPGATTALTSGGSTTSFTVALPSQAKCSGDTATGGYHVYSYLVHKGTALSGVTFNGFPSQGYGLVDTTGTYYGPVNTAATTGQIIGIPNNFQWGPLVSSDGVPLSTILYSGSGSSASGIWEGGLVCANSSGAVIDNWNTEVTFVARASDPNGFSWTAVPGPSGSAPAVFTSASSTTFSLGVTGTFTPTASGSPAPTITESGALPSGVTFTGGALSGKPTVSGTFPITFTATNGIEAPATQGFTLTVVSGTAPAFTSAASATFVKGSAGTFTPTATGSPAPTITESGTLPAGVTFSGGVLSGTPTATGSFPVTFTASNGIGSPATQSFTLTVVVIEITTTSLPTAHISTAYSAQLSEIGGVAPIKWSTNVKLPKGLKLNKATGAITGTVSKRAVQGTFPITFTVTDHAKPTKDTASATISITVSP